MKYDIEVDCRICTNCTMDSCKVYGNDSKVAVDACIRDNFKNYKKSEENEGE